MRKLCKPIPISIATSNFLVVNSRLRSTSTRKRLVPPIAFTHNGSSVGVSYTVTRPQPIAGSVYTIEPYTGNLTIKIINRDGGVVERQPIPSASLFDAYARTPQSPARSLYLDRATTDNCVAIQLPLSLSNETIGNHVYQAPVDTTVSPDNPKEEELAQEKIASASSPITFYLTDHLGNTRVTFRPGGSGEYDITYAAGYYPFGKVLREYKPCEVNRFLSTQHERDAASGYDNRGARLYDSELGLFLGVDPLADKFAAWSPYNYVLGNPVGLVDPDGAAPQQASWGTDPNSHKRWNFYRKFGHASFEAALSAGASNGYKGLYLVSQWRVENGFRSNPPSNNPFNIKGSGDAGTQMLGTTEYVDGRKTNPTEGFAKFSSIQKGLEAQISLLANNFPDAHRALIDQSATIDDYAQGLMNGRLGVFATDPNYVSKVTSMFKGIKRDYNKWFDYNLAVNARNMNVLQNLPREVVTGLSEEAHQRAEQDLIIQRARLYTEKESLNATN